MDRFCYALLGCSWRVVALAFFSPHPSPHPNSCTLLYTTLLSLTGRNRKVLSERACLVVPSHPMAVAKGQSICHVDAVPKPQTGWTKATRNLFYFASLIRVGGEVLRPRHDEQPA